jgi:hypothetical protein
MVMLSVGHKERFKRMRSQALPGEVGKSYLRM